MGKSEKQKKIKSIFVLKHNQTNGLTSGAFDIMDNDSVSIPLFFRNQNHHDRLCDMLIIQ